MVKSKSKPKPGNHSRRRPPKTHRPVSELLVPELVEEPPAAGPLHEILLMDFAGDREQLHRACILAMAKLADRSLDDAVRLRGIAWLYEQTGEDALAAAEARAAEAEAKYAALVDDVKAAFEASKTAKGIAPAADAMDALETAEDQAVEDSATAAGDGDGIELDTTFEGGIGWERKTTPIL
jgi:hypothetical protein